MKKVYKGCFVTLASDILQYGKISKAGTNGIITNIENGTLEVITEENRCIYCKPLELRKTRLMSYKEALETLKEYCGHHCKSSDQFQFNIKFHHYHIPNIVSELCRDDTVWDRYYEILSENIENFMGQNCDYGLNYIIHWLGSKAQSDWWQAGRSGGWLVVKCDTDYESSTESVDFTQQQMSDLRDLYDAAEDGEDRTDLVKEYKSLASSVKLIRWDIRVLASQLEFISKLIEAEKRSLGQYISSMEPWKELLTQAILEDHQEEFENFEEKEELAMPEIEPTKTAFELEINTARQQTEGYCTNAYRLLQMNSSSYSLLVSWEDRVGEAIHEREVLLKNARKHLAQLEEDIDVLKLLRHEITVRHNRQEQELAA